MNKAEVMNRIVKIILTVLLFLVALSSCVEDLDFNQFDDLQLTPSYEAGILYLEAPENVINLVNAGTDVFSQNYNFDAFSSDIFAERVLEGTIIYFIENTTSKELEITVEFLDEAGSTTDTELFTVQEAPSPILQREIAYGDSGRSIEIIKTLSTIRVTARNLGDNSSVSNLPNPMITLKSSGKFRVRLK